MLDELKKSDNGFRFLEAIFRYLYSTINMSPDEIIEIAVRSMASDKGELIMTAADILRKEGFKQGVQQGIQDGLLEAIDLGLLLRFEDQSQVLMQIISQIDDVEKLRAIIEAIKSVKDVSELRSMIEH